MEFSRAVVQAKKSCGVWTVLSMQLDDKNPAGLRSRHYPRGPIAVRDWIFPRRTLRPAASSRMPTNRRLVRRPYGVRPQKRFEFPSSDRADFPTQRLGITARNLQSLKLAHGSAHLLLVWDPLVLGQDLDPARDRRS